MKNRSQALLALAALAAASAATAMATEPPLKTLPSQQETWITGTIERGNGEYAPGDDTTLRLDRPSASPCNNKTVTNILLGKAGVPEPLLLLPYLGQRVAVRGRVICPDTASVLRRRRTSCFPSFDGRHGIAGPATRRLSDVIRGIGPGGPSCVSGRGGGPGWSHTARRLNLQPRDLRTFQRHSSHQAGIGQHEGLHRRGRG
jgi:hypothetical protein